MFIRTLAVAAVCADGAARRGGRRVRQPVVRHPGRRRHRVRRRRQLPHRRARRRRPRVPRLRAAAAARHGRARARRVHVPRLHRAPASSSCASPAGASRPTATGLVAVFPTGLRYRVLDSGLRVTKWNDFSLAGEVDLEELPPGYPEGAPMPADDVGFVDSCMADLDAAAADRPQARVRVRLLERRGVRRPPVGRPLDPARGRRLLRRRHDRASGRPRARSRPTSPPARSTTGRSRAPGSRSCRSTRSRSWLHRSCVRSSTSTWRRSASIRTCSARSPGRTRRACAGRVSAPGPTARCCGSGWSAGCGTSTRTSSCPSSGSSSATTRCPNRVGPGRA